MAGRELEYRFQFVGDGRWYRNTFTVQDVDSVGLPIFGFWNYERYERCEIWRLDALSAAVRVAGPGHR